MLILLNPSEFVLAHTGNVPHVHPHELGVVLALGLVLAFIVGRVAASLRRRSSAS